MIVGTQNKECGAYARWKTTGWKFELLMDDITRPWREYDCRSLWLDWVVQERKWGFLWIHWYHTSWNFVKSSWESSGPYARRSLMAFSVLQYPPFSSSWRGLKGGGTHIVGISEFSKVWRTLVLNSKWRHENPSLWWENTDILAWATTLSVISQALYARTQTQI